MRPSSSSFVLYALCSWVVAKVDPKCTQGLQALLAPLTAYPPATSFCKNKLPPDTKTSTVSTTTTVPVVITVVTTAPEITATLYTTITSTLTVTVNGPLAKRDAAAVQATATKADPKVVLWSSISKVAGQVLSTFCSCAVPVSTTTTTATLSTATTSTSTQTITPIATLTSTVTSTFTSITTVQFP